MAHKHPKPEVLLIYPNQLFSDHPGLSIKRRVVLVEAPRFFFDPQEKIFYHKQKLMLLRAAMRRYASRLQSRGYGVDYLEHRFALDPENLAEKVSRLPCGRIVLADPSDLLLDKELSWLETRTGLPVLRIPSPGFLNSRGYLEDFFREARHYSLTSFYIAQRRRLNLLVQDDKPLGGKWSFDPENRKRMPAAVKPPPLPPVREDAHVRAARAYVEENFPRHPGESVGFIYPFSTEEAREWLARFIRTGLTVFGDYQDSIRKDEPFLFHSLLSPLLNIGLLTPDEVISAALEHSHNHPGRVPLNALEGFIRQIVGWREFVRAVYLLAGEREFLSNFWNHHRPLPASFYSATTGMDPVDTVLRRVNRHGYAHHIERLMVLGNFLLLCEVNPREVYRWFMEMFVDAYEWVMVPNVFGMSQFADGGLITTKPYISSSNYILKMSDFSRGDWCPVWDGLYWRFIHRHRDFFARNPRLSIMAAQLDRMGGEKLAGHLRTAEDYLNQLA